MNILQKKKKKQRVYTSTFMYMDNSSYKKTRQLFLIRLFQNHPRVLYYFSNFQKKNKGNDFKIKLATEMITSVQVFHQSEKARWKKLHPQIIKQNQLGKENTCWQIVLRTYLAYSLKLAVSMEMLFPQDLEFCEAGQMSSALPSRRKPRMLKSSFFKELTLLLPILASPK